MRTILIFELVVFGIITGCKKENPKPSAQQVNIKQAVYVGSQDKNMYALDVSSGAKIWSFPLAGRVYGSLVSSNGLVYVTDVDSYKMVAIDANLGQKKWEFVGDYYAFTYPCVSDDLATVYFGTWSGPGIDGKLYALDGLTGNLKWTFTSSKNVNDNIREQKGIVFCSSDEKIYALNALNGSVNWMFNGTSTNFTGPIVSNEILYFGNDNAYYSLDATTGSQKWKFNVSDSGYVVSSPLIVDQSMYVIGFDGVTSNLYSLNLLDGKINWKYTFQDGSGFECPYYSDGNLYIKSYNGTFTVLKSTGEKIWERNLGIFYSTSPIVANGIIYVTDGSQNKDHSGIYALDSSTGDLKWKYSTTEGASSTISVVTNGKIYNSSILGY